MQDALRAADRLFELANPLSQQLAQQFAPSPAQAELANDLHFVLENLAAAVEFGSSGIVDRALAWWKVRVCALGAGPAVAEQMPAALLALAELELDAAALAPLRRLLANAAVYLRFASERAPLGQDPRLAPGTRGGVFLAGALRGDRLATAAAIDGLEAGRALDEVLEPAQREIGRMWQNGVLTPPQEHLVTHQVQRLVDDLLARQPLPAVEAPCVALVRAAEDEHGLGQDCLALHLHGAGLRTRCVVAPLPPAAVVPRLVALAPAAVALTCTTARHLRPVQRAIAAIRTEPALAPCYVMVGGSMFRDVPQLATQIGADGGAVDGAAAARQLRQRLLPVHA